MSRWTRLRRKAFERETQLSSLQLTVDNNNLVGSCDVGYSCAYSNTLSWLTPTLPLMSENDPRVVFERLFGSSDSTDPRVRSARLRQDRSILDSVTARVRQLQQKLGAADNTKVSDYLESLRDVERRIQKAEEQSSRELPEVDRPVGHSRFVRRARQLLYDLQVLAYQCDLTRVITFMYGREQSARTYPQLGISDPHHQLTHHQNDPEKLEKCTKIQTHHVELFTAYLEKLRSIPDGDGSLLDNWSSCSARASATATGTPTARCRPWSSGRRRDAQGRPSPRVSGGHAADQSPRHAARQGGRSRRETGRQHRNIQAN